jgi:hypothetical protein
MNHFQSLWKSQTGRAIPYEYWEARQGLYRWVALVFPDPFLPFAKNAALLRTLVDLRFKVYSFPLRLGREGNPADIPFDELESSIRGIANHLKEKENLPIVPVVFSLNAIPFLASARDSGELYRFALLMSPILNWEAPPLRGPLFLRRNLSVEAKAEDLVAQVEALKEYEASLARGVKVAKKTIRQMRRRYQPLPENLDTGSDYFPLALFKGDDDPYLDQDALRLLAESFGERLTVFGYPRSRHLLCLDKYVEHVKRDLAQYVTAH